jgi:putative transposase
LIDSGHLGLSIVRQCELVSVSRSTFYREPAPETALNLTLMRLVDEQFLETPWYGSRQMMRYLRRQGHTVGRERVRRLMAKMGFGGNLSAAKDNHSASGAPDLSVSAPRLPPRVRDRVGVTGRPDMVDWLL